MLTAYSAGDPRLPPSTDVPPVTIRSVINFYGSSDIALLYRTCESPDYVRPLTREYIGGPPQEFPDRYRLLFPLTHVTAKAPPTITILGTSDRLVSLPHADMPGPDEGRRTARNVLSARQRSRPRRQLGRLRHADRTGQDQAVPREIR